MPPTAHFFLPPPRLASCVFGAIVRDTRGANLTAHARFNHFPASPLMTVSYLAEGQLYMTQNSHDIPTEKTATPLSKLSVMEAQDTPITSWNAGDVYAISVGIYPDAWTQIKAESPDIMADFSRAFASFDTLAPSQAWDIFCDELDPLWRQTRVATQTSFAPARLSDWSRALMTRAAMAGPGRSIRALERRLKRWSGQTRRSLAFYASFEDLGKLRRQNQDAPLAALAQDAGFSDQSHMGRAVRRATGFSPAQLNRRIETDEAFWCYRLLGERF